MITVRWQHANGDNWEELFTSMEEAVRLYLAILNGAAECNYVLAELVRHDVVEDDVVVAHWEVEDDGK